jgi:hypothetical protein
MSGKFVTVSGSTITLGHPGKDDTTHSVAAGATVTRDGVAAKLTDLQAGDHVSLSGDPATSVSATSP